MKKIMFSIWWKYRNSLDEKLNIHESIVEQSKKIDKQTDHSNHEHEIDERNKIVARSTIKELQEEDRSEDVDIYQFSVNCNKSIVVL